MVDFGPGLIAIGAGIAVGLAALGTGLAQSSIGAAGLGLMAEKDGKEGQVLIMLALPETIVILGFVIAFFLLGKMV
ncbi:MAG TPA: hypothetical protein VI875_01385 [Candidatus Norongarragalinales archaeon]|nr:hypothetical protein [Candidatus Norongarragalinales archaeon]